MKGGGEWVEWDVVPVRYKDYYATLGVPRAATEEEIKRSFRKLARKYHPDVAKDKKQAEDLFKGINEAYEVLGDPESRRKYDELGAQWREEADFRPPPGWESRGRRQGTRRAGTAADPEFQFSGTGFSDFFDRFFSGGAARGASPPPPGAGGKEVGDRGVGRRVGDIESDVLVTLDEVMHGAVRAITQGRLNAQTGKVDRTSLQVRIPPGVREGQLIRVSGRGQMGPGGASGDLYLRVRLAKHPDYRVQGLDLWTDLSMAPWEAVLGATITLRGLDGPLALKVPAGSRSGQQLRIRAHGLPSTDGLRGDLYVVVAIEVPTQLSAEEVSLWERLAKVSNFHPREGH